MITYHSICILWYIYHNLYVQMYMYIYKYIACARACMSTYLVVLVAACNVPHFPINMDCFGINHLLTLDHDHYYHFHFGTMINVIPI